MLRKIKSIGDLAGFDEGVLDRLFARELEASIGDCIDRPALDKARKVTLEVRLTPVAGDSGHLAEIEMQCEIKATRPASATRGVACRNDGVKGLVYDDLSPDNPRQMTMPIEQRDAS